MPNGIILRKLCVKCLCMYVLFYYKSLWNRLSVSLCHSVRVSASVRTISPEPFKHFFFFFLTKLGMAVYYHEAECTEGKKKKKKRFTVFNVKVTPRVYIVKL